MNDRLRFAFTFLKRHKFCFADELDSQSRASLEELCQLELAQLTDTGRPTYFLLCKPQD